MEAGAVYVACMSSLTFNVPELPETRDHVTGRLELKVVVAPICECVADGLTVRPPLVIRFCPVPVREIVCGEPAAESTMESVAASTPTMDGVNETLIVQLAPDGTVAGQEFDVAKSAAFAPARPMLVTVKNEVPESVSVTTCDPLLVVIVCPPNERDDLSSETCGLAPPPPPASCVQLFTDAQA
jgi:hypothetical protein